MADHRQPIEECFPDEPAAGWPAVKQRYPETVGVDGRWQLPIHTFLIRAPELGHAVGHLGLIATLERVSAERRQPLRAQAA